MTDYSYAWDKVLQIGDVKVWRLVDTETDGVPPEVILPKAKRDCLESSKDWLIPSYLDEQYNFKMANQSFLVQVDGMLILIEGAVGNGKPRMSDWASGLTTDYLQRLSNTGFQPEDVNIVLTSHFHMDHVGWLTRIENGKWVPTFKNAKYLFVREEYAYWSMFPSENEPDASYSFIDSVLPIMNSGLGELVTADYRINNQVYLEPAFGHTPGHTIVHVESGETHIVFAGDIFHHPIQVEKPEWCAEYFDTDVKKAYQARLDLIKRYADTETLIIPVHFTTCPVGYIRSHKDKLMFESFR